MSPLPRQRALAILDECRGDEIWSIEYCRQRGVPDAWIEELADSFESGFRNDSETIYWKGQVTNQYHGVPDIKLAIAVARSMGLDVDRVTAAALGRVAVVRAIREAVMDD
ncbi:MAG: hypothetical protein ACO1RT_14980 [Planctomycetaceae bacterium]